MLLMISALQIVAVILCDTGVALLAYMDGITGSPTLSGVVLAACAAAGSAVYKVRVIRGRMEGSDLPRVFNSIIQLYTLAL